MGWGINRAEVRHIRPGTYLTERTGIEIQSLPVAALHVARTTLAQPLSFSDLYSTLCAEGEIFSAMRECENETCLCGGSMGKARA
jgi:hypothetical protein